MSAALNISLNPLFSLIEKELADLYFLLKFKITDGTDLLIENLFPPNLILKVFSFIN